MRVVDVSCRTLRVGKGTERARRPNASLPHPTLNLTCVLICKRLRWDGAATTTAAAAAATTIATTATTATTSEERAHKTKHGATAPGVIGCSFS